MKPIPLTQTELVAVLRNMAELVEEGDSFEGSIEYAMPIPETEGETFPEGTYALVRASYRIGNSMGQGGLRTVGEL